MYRPRSRSDFRTLGFKGSRDGLVLAPASIESVHYGSTIYCSTVDS